MGRGRESWPGWAGRAFDHQAQGVLYSYVLMYGLATTSSGAKPKQTLHIWGPGECRILEPTTCTNLATPTLPTYSLLLPRTPYSVLRATDQVPLSDGRPAPVGGVFSGARMAADWKRREDWGTTCS